MYKRALKGSLEPTKFFSWLKYKIDYARANSTFFNTFGTCVFCGAQGEGKTLSAVQYVENLRKRYPRAILVSNVALKSYPFNTEMYYDENGGGFGVPSYRLRRIGSGLDVNTDTINLDCMFKNYEPITIEYTGLEMLKYISNAEYGVIFLIDEIHLELNSLESKNIDIEIMVEISQQRKQRKHIVGTSQIFMRMAKPLREQIHDVIICHNFFSGLQFNKWIDGMTAVEDNGKLKADVKGRYMWWHTPQLYSEYDTFVKMKRYNKEWQGRKRIDDLFIGGVNQ